MKEKEDELVDKKVPLSERIQPGDPYLSGPLIKSPDGDVKDKNISLITDNFKLNIFVNAANIRNYASTAEKTINNLNHFYNVFKDKRHENILADVSFKIDSKLRDFLLRTSSKSHETDTSVVANIICENLEPFFKDDFLADVADYVTRYSYYDESIYDNAVKNYNDSLDPTGIKIVLMISVVLKQIWLITKRTINATKISRRSIDIDSLNTKITITIFERAMKSCSYVYMNNKQANWDGEPYDLHTKFVSYFMDRTDKVINDNMDHITTKHAVLGTTEASILSSTYITLCENIRKVTLVIAYKPGLIPNDDIEAYMRKHHKQQMETDDQYIYVPNLELFGFNVSRTVKYIVSGLRDHVSYNGPRKKEDVAASIADAGTDDDDDSVSRRDKLLKKDDIMNPEQKRINEMIKCSLIENLSSKLSSGSDMMLVNAVKKIQRNALNMTILSMYLDYLGINTGNPLSYMNSHDFAVTLISITKWELLKPYKTLLEALLSDKNEPAFCNVTRVNEFMDEHYEDDINRDAIQLAIVSILSYDYSQRIGNSDENYAGFTNVFEIPIEEILGFILDYKHHRDDFNERI